MPRPLTAILIGDGDRGYATYSPYALQQPEELRFVAVAEPRARLAQAHNIPPDRQFVSLEDRLDQDQIVDSALVTTVDGCIMRQSLSFFGLCSSSGTQAANNYLYGLNTGLGRSCFCS